MKIRRISLLIALSLATTVVVAAGATDIAVGNSAQQRVVQAVTCRLQPTGPVTAELTDTLAGLQVLSGNLGTVRITADGVHRGGTDLNVNAVLYNVTTQGSTDGGTATATIPYSALQQHLGTAATSMTVGTDGTGLTFTGTLGSLGLPATVATSIATTSNRLTITPTSVAVLGQAIPVSVLSSMPGGSSLAGNLKPRTIDLPSLPAGARLTGARPDSTGLGLLLSIPHTDSLTKATGTPARSHCSSAKA